MTLAQWAGVTLAVVGVVVLSTAGDIGRLLELSLNRGDVLVLIAALLYAGYSVALRNKPEVGALSMFAVLACAAALTSLPILAIEGVSGEIVWPTHRGWLIVLLVAVFPSMMSQVFFIKGVEAIGSGRAGVFVNLVPVFAAGLAVVVLGEPFEWFQVVALGFVLAGIGLSERSVMLARRVAHTEGEA